MNRNTDSYQKIMESPGRLLSPPAVSVQNNTAQLMVAMLQNAQGADNALTAQQIQRICAFTIDRVHKIMSRMIQLRRISRAKGIRGKRIQGNIHCTQYYYWLDADQARKALVYQHIVQPDVSLHKHLNEVDIPARLSFLENLKSNSAFANYAVLDAIIIDYRRALADRTADLD